MADIPTGADVAEYMNLSAGYDPDPIDDALEAALDAQRIACPGIGAEPYTPALRRAAIRRAARSLALRPNLLGVTFDMGEFGPVEVRRWDAEIEEYEGPYRDMVVA